MRPHSFGFAQDRLFDYAQDKLPEFLPCHIQITTCHGV
jgi:hypothetical protein